MEDYMRENCSSNNTGTTSTTFLYGSGGGSVVAPDTTTIGNDSDPGGFQNFQYHHSHNHNHHPVVKIESGGAQKFHNYPSIMSFENEDEALKAKIISHPHYSNLLQAYMDCQKVGAPPEVAGRLTTVRHEYEARQRAILLNTSGCRDSYKDPELDQFMEAYYDMLIKYKEELARPIQEATEFMRQIESQLSTFTISSTNASMDRIFISPDDSKGEVIGSSDEEHEHSGGETELPEIDPRAEDRELKNHLLRKYSGYLSSLKQELSKKKKKGKLPKEARQKLLSWWELHYKWPYPSESEKVALADSTGLDQKQINNWFINQRKRHWKPSEDMQFMVMDGLHPQNASTALYMEGHYMGEGPYRLGP